MCVLFCFFSLSLNSSAVGDIAYEDWIDIGYVDAGDGVLYLPPDVELPSFFSNFNSSPRYPDFNPNQLPWLDMPTYIKDIVYSDISQLSNLSAQPPEDFRVPFVCVINYGDHCNVWVGYNLAFGYVNDNGYIRIFGCGSEPYSSSYWFSKNVCYMATYDISESGVITLRTDFSERTGSKFYSGKRLVYYSPNFNGSTADFYVYGANALCYQWVDGAPYLPSRFTIYDDYVNYPDSRYVIFGQSVLGFYGGELFSGWDETYNFYWKAFTPPTAEVLEQETSKGIWDTLKSIPDMIAEKFKGLFIPEEGFFDTYIQEFQDYFKDRFGLVYELSDAVLDILQQLVDYEPSDEGYYIDFPEVVMPVLDDGEWRDVVLIEETEVRFEFLNEGPIATLYSMYRSALWLTYIFLLINLIIRKGEKILGGNSG